MNEGEAIWLAVRILAVTVPVIATFAAFRHYDINRNSKARAKLWDELRVKQGSIDALEREVAKFVAREELERKFGLCVAELKEHVSAVIAAHERTELARYDLMQSRIEWVGDLIRNGHDKKKE